MSSYLSVYLGPYVEARFRPEMRLTDMFGCTNEKCGTYARRSKFSWEVEKKFCSECGSAWGKTQSMLPYRPNPMEAMGDRENLTWIEDTKDPTVFYYLSNLRPAKGQRDFSYHEGGDAHVSLPVDGQSQALELTQFQKRFEADIALLSAVYDVQLKWGLHLYWR